VGRDRRSPPGDLSDANFIVIRLQKPHSALSCFINLGESPRTHRPTQRRSAASIVRILGYSIIGAKGKAPFVNIRDALDMHDDAETVPLFDLLLRTTS